MTHTYDCIFINPNDVPETYGILNNGTRALQTPGIAMMLSQSCIDKGFRSRVLDCHAEDYTSAMLLEFIKNNPSRLLVIAAYGQHPSATTQTMVPTIKTSLLIKENFPHQKVLITGGHPTVLPELTLKETHADYVAVGEGIYTILSLLATDNPQLAEVPGLCYLHNNSVNFGPAAPLVPQEEMDSVYSGLDLEYIDFAKYQTPNWSCYGKLNERNYYATIHTGFGCPYGCSYCSINAPFGKRGYRHWSVDHSIEQIDRLVKRGVRNIKLADELFTLKESHYTEICRRIIEKNYKLSMWTFVRVADIPRQNLELMKKAGVDWITIGFESYDARIREGVNKGDFTVADMKRMVERVNDCGISINGNYVFGLPGDTVDSMQRTLDLAMDLNTEAVNMYAYMAFPGCQNFAENKDHVLQNFTWENFSQYSKHTKPYGTETLSPAEVLTFRDQAWEIYNRNPRYLDKIRSKFGEETVHYIAKTCLVPLERNYKVQEQLAKANYR